MTDERSGDRAWAAGWRTLSTLHRAIDANLERALQKDAGLSVVEFMLLDVLSQQVEGHLRMQEVANSVALSTSATTRLVNRLEDRSLLSRVLCGDDRRGIFTELTPAGRVLIELARPVHDSTLKNCLTEASQQPELAPFVEAVNG